MIKVRGEEADWSRPQSTMLFKCKQPGPGEKQKRKWMVGYTELCLDDHDNHQIQVISRGDHDWEYWSNDGFVRICQLQSFSTVHLGLNSWLYSCTDTVTYMSPPHHYHWWITQTATLTLCHLTQWALTVPKTGTLYLRLVYTHLHTVRLAAVEVSELPALVTIHRYAPSSLSVTAAMV